MIETTISSLRSEFLKLNADLKELFKERFYREQAQTDAGPERLSFLQKEVKRIDIKISLKEDALHEVMVEIARTGDNKDLLYQIATKEGVYEELEKKETTFYGRIRARLRRF